MQCEKCGKEIPKERLEIFPDTKYCVNCVDDTLPQYKCYMVYSHKTAPQISIIDARNKEAERICDRANRRAR